MFIETELHSDLETIYKIAGDLLNDIEMNTVGNYPDDTLPNDHELLERVRFSLEDITGTLQKDIHNLRHVIAKKQLGETGV
jgi:flagellar motor switch protein FliG